MRAKIIAGLSYDNRLPNRLKQQLGTEICGEQRLIEALEFRTGITTSDESAATRTVSYLKALKATDNGLRFYSHSLSVDPMASAEELLKWRDWAIFHGWNNDDRSRSNGRLADLIAVEELFASSKVSIGERIYKLLPRLETAVLGIALVELHHVRASWPTLFQHLFDVLEKTDMQIIEAPISATPQAPADSDLGKLQRALSRGETEALALQQDGTLRLFTASSNQYAAAYAIREANAETLVIAQSHQHSLETVIAQLGGNRSGLGDLSASRAPNQLLLLLLQCSWHTPSANTVLQYLTLPAGRFQRLRRRIARQFRDLPGFDRERWQPLIDAFVISESESRPTCDEKALRESIDEWLPICSCDNDETMPITLAMTLSDRVAKYWQARLTTSDEETSREVFAGTLSAADAISQALRDWPETAISKIQLNRLTTMVLSIGSSRYRQPREVSIFDTVSHAEVVPLRDQPVNHTIWIDPSVSARLEIPPLSKEELAGIPLAPNLTQQDIQNHNALIRSYAPILAAEQTLTLIAIDTMPELLKLQLSELSGDSPWMPIENAILTNQEIHAVTQPISDLELTQKKRWWSIDIPIPAPRKKESYSSLSSLALKPHEYALMYAAQINESTVESLSADARLKGNTAHYLVERWIKEHEWTGHSVNQSDISSWLDRTLPGLIRRVALPLAQPGLQVERELFRQQMLNALHTLIEALVAAHVTSLQPELHIEYEDRLGQLIGSMDIFCELEDGDFAIIDMKWGGYAKYREELKAGRPLQLATYAHIAEGAQPGQLVDAGYFILGRAELLCNHDRIFPTATIVEPDEPNNLQLTWNRFEKTLHWRMDQYQQGRIELTHCGTPADTSSEPPADTLDLLGMESTEQKKRLQTYKATYKAVDVWRNLTGNIREI